MERTWSSSALYRRFPVHGWMGLGLVALFWPLNWLLDGIDVFVQRPHRSLSYELVL